MTDIKKKNNLKITKHCTSTKILILFVILFLAGCAGGPLGSLGSLGWYHQYDLDKSELSYPVNSPRIAKALENKTPKTVLKVLHCLARFGSQARQVVPEIANTTFLSKNKAVRRKGASTLYIIGYDPEQIIPSMQKAMEYDNDNIQKDVLEFYLALNSDTRYDSLIPYVQTLTTDSRGSVSKKALIAMRSYADRPKIAEFAVTNKFTVFAHPRPKYYNGHRTINLTAHGIMPIDLIMSNKSIDSIRVSPERVFIIDDTGRKVDMVEGSKVFGAMNFSYSSVSKAIVNANIKNTLGATLFREAIIEPGNDLQKTIYCRCPPDKQTLSDWTIRLVATKVGTIEEPIIVEMRL